ncbi:MAG: porin family protein [Hydrogenophaga sp.]|nr:porin family protein [Hydrogenophaga sp.]
MTRIAKLTTALGLAVLAAGAQAQSIYGEVDYTGLNYKASGLKVKPGMVRGIVGYEITPNLAVEGMLGLNASSDSTSGMTAKIDNAIGVFGKAQAPLTDALKLYGRVGVVRSSLKVNGSKDNTTDLAYGAGMTYDLSKTTYLNVDYTRYLDKNSQKLDGVSAGIGFRF